MSRADDGLQLGKETEKTFRKVLINKRNKSNEIGSNNKSIRTANL